MPRISSPQRYAKPKGATRVLAVDFSDMLESGETLSGTPTITASSSTVTVSGAAINSSGSMVVLGTTVATSKVVTFYVAAGTSGKAYNFNVSVGTNNSQTFIWNVGLDVTGNTT